MEGCRESRRCSRDTYPESYITKYTSIRKNHGRCPGRLAWRQLKHVRLRQLKHIRLRQLKHISLRQLMYIPLCQLKHIPLQVHGVLGVAELSHVHYLAVAVALEVLYLT